MTAMKYIESYRIGLSERGYGRLGPWPLQVPCMSFRVVTFSIHRLALDPVRLAIIDIS
jgi:hypothetical protein